MELPNKYPVYFERKPYYILLVLLVVIISGYITYQSFRAYTVYHIYSAFVCAVSTVYLSWLYFNPFSEIHPEHFEINHGLFSHKKFSYRDIQKLEYDDNQKTILIIFNDHESSIISIKMLKKDERKKYVEMIKMHVYKDLLGRDE
ncbi:MAG: hypothetical protein Fur0023_09060 [Bacteroidia bacterium]